ncbi:glycosyltransferase [Nodosilinea sp. LEGE 07088]|uniref:glycosyltransferase n=1 Tax=Nodosilinea sp. LEGE 07088 TaxID=2777968 RepID=UPI001880974D|nr:glycosyltransferase [Nodosilinea sp. LEGE 07088]MBE9137700.1 glycosyltransferase [Nodosilinea sp. LEGE 07088]
MASEKPSLLIFYQYDPWHSSIGGIQTVINNFIKYSPKDFDIGVVGGLSSGGYSLGHWYERSFQGKTIRFLPIIDLGDDNVRGFIPTTLKYTLALAKARKLLNADFMHFHRLEPSLAVSGVSARKTLFVHNDIHQQMYGADQAHAILWRSLPQVYFWLEESLIRRFDDVLSCNTDSLTFYKARYPNLSERLRLVKNTVDTDVFSFSDTADKNADRLKLIQELGLASETQFIFFAGRFHPQKDPLLLVRALSQLQMASAHLLLAGAGELEADIKAEVKRLGLGRQVTFLGRLSPPQMAAVHRAASVFALTSIYEGLPMVALEALSCGTPVMTTNCGETPHLLTSGSGVVATQRDPHTVSESLRVILEHPTDFPAEACSKAAKPYHANVVIEEIYNTMRLQLRRKTD